ncbi:UBX domain-containing protein 6 [Folsomia candida]|uniref:UBX domain-containing protein 6 n=1 Tax=Folsomia candida TaxID=158441 RepID=UPI001604C1DD|nr:UBX domain-containing protein 6 [Folsomia candida]
MGEFRGCLICLEPCTVKKCDVEVIKDKEPEICTGHNEELNLMFILKKVLNVPSELIARNLIKHGSPSEWGISVCGSCKLTYLERAKILHDEATSVEMGFKTLRNQVAEHISNSKINEEVVPGGTVPPPRPPPVKGRGKRKGGSGQPSPVFNEIRSWVVQNGDDEAKKNVEIMVKAAGGITNYVAQLDAEKTFKTLGPGRKLTDTSEPKAGPSSAICVSSKVQIAVASSSCTNTNQSSSASMSSSSTGNLPSGGGNPSQPSAASQAASAAAAAALARFAKSTKPQVDSKELLASRQCAFIKEQARKELEAEQQTSENGGGDSTNDNQPCTSSDAAGKKAENGHVVIDPACYAVQGVFYRCPEIECHTPVSRAEIDDKIREYLLKQLKNSEADQYLIPCQMIHSCNKPLERVTTCIDTLWNILNKIIHNPTELKYQQIRCLSQAFQEKIHPVFGGEIFLKAAAFQKVLLPNKSTFNEEEEYYWEFNPEDDTTFGPELMVLRDLLKSTVPIKPELDRNVQVLRAQQVAIKSELPDEFYTLSKEEVKREQQLKTETVERELTLRTKAMRDRDATRELRIYRFGVMRIRFPDSKILQGTFSASDKLSSLFKFVRKYLVSAELEEFDLIQPGGETLNKFDMETRLSELKLLPSSVLMFKLEHTPEALMSGEVSYLNPDLLMKWEML